MNLQEHIRKVLREETHIPPVIIRRISTEIIEEAFESALDRMSESMENPNSVIYKEKGTTLWLFAKFVIDEMVTYLEQDYFTNDNRIYFEDDDFYYDKIRKPLLRHYGSRIKERYNQIVGSMSDNQQEMKEGELTEKCWKGYTQKGMKTMFGKRYPNCVKKKSKTLKEAKNSEEDFNVETVINKIIPKKFKWFKKIEINHISYDEFFHKITIHGKLKVDEKWGEKRWREYHEYKPFPSNSGWEDENPVLLGEIVKKGELNDLNNELELIISSIGGYPIIDTIRSEYLRLYFV